MTERPGRTVTLLFSDIEGSTRLLHEVGVERYGTALEDHRRLVREAIASAGGTEIDTQGDSFFVVFARAEDAAQAAIRIQRSIADQDWSESAAIRIRIGIHSTAAHVNEGSYVGIGVHRAARICSAGHGGQVLLSNATAELLRDADVPVGLIDLGLHRLKDLAEPEHLFQLAADGVADRFPPIRSLANRPTNLPRPLTPLVGRQRELDDIGAVLERAEVRLLTLTGAGGSGKSRLALEAAARALDKYADGVFLVRLAPVTDSALVLPTIAEALGISESAGQSLSAYLSSRQLLLVIDNVEQVVDAGPELAELLAVAPGVRMLLTSREPVHISAEHVHAVEPMVPDDAVAFFAERAAAALAGFTVTDDNRDAVEEICRRLDGLPLAIELAAARINLLPPRAMLSRLSDRLTLLTGGRRDQPSRQRTLRDTLAWSHDLLTDAERDLFARLSVFAGWFGLDAAETVCGAGIETLGALVDRSLVRRRGDRFGMLATIREYAAEQLASHADAEAVRDQHAAFFEAVAERAHAERHQRTSEMADALALDHDDVREALDRLSRSDPRRFAHLTGLVGWFWHARSHFAEGRARVKAALAKELDAAEDHARLLSAATELAAWQGDAVAAEAFGNQALAAWEMLENGMEIALVQYDLGWAAFFAGHDEAARGRFEASLEILEPHGDDVLSNRAKLGLLQVLVAIGDVATVRRLGPEALEVSRVLGDRWSEHFAHHFLGDCALIEGDMTEAEHRYRLSLEAAWETGDQVESCYELQGLAMAAAGSGRADRALRLASAASSNISKLGVESIPPFWTALVDRHVGLARAASGDESADAAWAAGARLTLQEAVTEALGE